jgi:lysophospholipase L1-like esterase
VALGDSTTAGTPAHRSPIEAPPGGAGNVESQYAHWLMQAHPDWRVLNRGVNGERSDQIRARFARDAVQPKPAAVVIIAGVNDVYQGRSAVHRAGARAMYDAARAAGSRSSPAASSRSTPPPRGRAARSPRQQLDPRLRGGPCRRGVLRPR